MLFLINFLRFGISGLTQRWNTQKRYWYQHPRHAWQGLCHAVYLFLGPTKTGWLNWSHDRHTESPGRVTSGRPMWCLLLGKGQLVTSYVARYPGWPQLRGRTSIVSGWVWAPCWVVWVPSRLVLGVQGRRPPYASARVPWGLTGKVRELPTGGAGGRSLTACTSHVGAPGPEH